jgi:hypothetical protein
MLLHTEYLGMDLFWAGLLNTFQLSQFLQNVWQETEKSSSLQTSNGTQSFTELNTA